MAHPQSDGRWGYGGEIVPGEFVEARSDTAEMLEFVEEALDQVAVAIDFQVNDAADLDVALARDMGGRAVGLDQLDDGAREEAAVDNHVARQT